MDDQRAAIDNLDGGQKRALLGALAELSLSDRRLADEERELFGEFADWLAIDRRQAEAELERRSDPARLVLPDLPARVRALVFVTGALAALVDGRFDQAERRDLARLAAGLGIAPQSARAALADLKRRDTLRGQLRQALEQAGPLAERQSVEQSAKRSVSLVLGIFVGFGVGVFAWPAVVPGAVVGLVAGAIGGGLVGRTLTENERLAPEDYDFSDL